MNWINILLIAISAVSFSLFCILTNKYTNSFTLVVSMIISAIVLFFSTVASFSRDIPYITGEYVPSNIVKTTDFLTVVTYNGSVVYDNTAKLYNTPESNIVFVVTHYKNAWNFETSVKNSIAVK